MTSSPLFAVAGVSGQTGAAVADALLDSGARVRAIVRDAAKGEAWAARGAEVAVASLTDVPALTRALQGAHGAYVLNPPAYASPDLFAEAERVGEAWLRALQAAGVRRIALLSSIGAQLPAGTGNIVTTHRHEALFRGSGLPGVAVRAAFFMDNWKGVLPLARQAGILPSFLAPPDRAVAMVSSPDIGRACADALREEGAGWRAVELEGPALYSPNDVAAVFARVLGRPVQVAPVPEAGWPAALAQMGNSPRSVEGWTEMMRAFNAGQIRWEGGAIPRRRGTVTLEQAVRAMAG